MKRTCQDGDQIFVTGRSTNLDQFCPRCYTNIHVFPISYTPFKGWIKSGETVCDKETGKGKVMVIHLVKWKNIIRSKRQGGLDIKNLKNQEQSS